MDSSSKQSGNDHERPNPTSGYEVLLNSRCLVVSVLSREPTGLANSLQEKGLLSPELVEDIQILPTPRAKANKIFTEILSRIEHFPQHYETIISLFRQNPLLYGDFLQGFNHELSSSSSSPEYLQPPPAKRIRTENDCLTPEPDTHTPPNEEASLDSVQTVTDCQTLTTPPVTEEGATQLRQEVQKLEKEFKVLTKKGFNTIRVLNLPLDKFYAEVSCMDVSLRSTAGDYFKQCFMRANHDGSFGSLWGDLNQFWDFYNYELFQHIVEVMFDEATNPLVKEVMKYAERVDFFSSSTKVCHFLEVWPFSMDKPAEHQIAELKIVTARVKKKWHECTLLHVKEVSKTLARAFFIQPEFFSTSGSGPGSVLILCYVPSCIAETIDFKINKETERILSENDFISVTVDGVQVYPLSSVKHYSLEVKKLYKSRFSSTDSKIPSKGALMPFKLALIIKLDIWTSADSYTMTTMKGNNDDVRYRKVATTLSALGQTSEGKPARLVLIEGAPGAGKTLFSREVCKKWSSRQFLPNVSFLILYPLRDYNLTQVTSLHELFAVVKPELEANSLVEELRANSGKGVALWLDGWDEIANAHAEKESSIFRKLISGEILPKAQIFVTSRPWATGYIKSQLEKRNSQHIEIVSSVQDQIDRLNLLKEQQQQSIKFLSLLDSVLKNLNNSPAIQDNMHTPLATDITVKVYQWCIEFDYPLPKTVTELYKAYTILCVREYVDQHSRFRKSWKSNDLRELPEPLCLWFSSLSHLAVEGLLNGQRLVFPDVPNELKLETLGVMRMQPPLYGNEESAVMTYHYNHLTLQEFLAAWSLTLVDNERRDKLVQDHIFDGLLTVTLRFYSGLTKSFPLSKDKVKKMVASSDSTSTLTVFHWIFEGGEASIADIFDQREMNIKSQYSWSVLDYFVTGHCIAKTNCQWNIDFSSSYMGDEKMEQFLQAFCRESESGDKGSACISTMDLTHNDLNHGLNHLQNVPASFLCSLKSLDLSWNNLDFTAIDQIAKAIPYLPKLDVLNLRWNSSIQEGGIVPLAIALCDHTALKVLDLTATKIGKEDCKHLAQLLASTQSLDSLTLNDNALSAVGVRMLFKGLQLNRTLKKLDMHKNCISVRAMKILSDYFEDNTNCKLSSLDLRYCNITPDVAAEFSRGLSLNSSVKLLRLSYNPIGDKGTVALGKAIEQNQKLTKISLVKCLITDTGAAALASSLMINSTMDKLYINTNSIGKAICDFAPVLRCNKTLKLLDIRNDDSFSQSDIDMLIQSLADNQTIEELRLPDKFEVAGTDKRVQWQ